MRRPSEVDLRSWELHRRNGHPEGYEGPCWGPTLAEREQVKREAAAPVFTAVEPQRGEQP